MDICVEKIVIPKPVISVFLALVLSANIVSPYLVPSYLMVFVPLGKNLLDFLCQLATEHPLPIVIPCKMLMSIFTCNSTDRVAAVEDNTVYFLAHGRGREIDFSADGFGFETLVANVFHIKPP